MLAECGYCGAVETWPDDTDEDEVLEWYAKHVLSHHPQDAEKDLIVKAYLMEAAHEAAKGNGTPMKRGS